MTAGEYPSRSTIRGLLAGLVDGTVDPEEVSDWAFEFLGADTSTDYDKCVQDGLDHLAIAEPIPVEHGGPLYTRLDYIDWLEQFDRCAERLPDVAPEGRAQRLEFLYQLQNSRRLAASLIDSGCTGVRAATSDEVAQAERLWGAGVEYLVECPTDAAVFSRWAGDDLDGIVAWVHLVFGGHVDEVALRTTGEDGMGLRRALVVVRIDRCGAVLARALDRDGLAVLMPLAEPAPVWVLIDETGEAADGARYECEAWRRTTGPRVPAGDDETR
ncbi:MAG: hypothetical protein HGA44_08130 [Cellulomonadaceae bacterium]|nr:hypothetical protein [Cellulomonadaceae bacterium]